MQGRCEGDAREMRGRGEGEARERRGRGEGGAREVRDASGECCHVTATQSHPEVSRMPIECQWCIRQEQIGREPNLQNVIGGWPRFRIRAHHGLYERSEASAAAGGRWDLRRRSGLSTQTGKIHHP